LSRCLEIWDDFVAPNDHNKVACSILQNKLRNLKEYDSKFGTNIIQSLSKNIMTYDDIFIKSLSSVNLNGCGGQKYLADEVQSVTNIYNDLLTQISNSQAGCGLEGASTEMDKNSKKEINGLKSSFLNVMGMKSNPRKSKGSAFLEPYETIGMEAKKKSKKSKKSKASVKTGKTKKASKTKKGSKTNHYASGHNIIF